LRRQNEGLSKNNKRVETCLPGYLLIYCTLLFNIDVYLVSVVWLDETFSWVWGYFTGHLWFLQALLLFAVIYVVYRIFSDRDPDHKRYQYYPDRFPSNRTLIFSIAVLAALTFAVRIFVPIGEWIGGIQPAYFVHYIFCFFVGILAYRGDWFSRLKGSQAKPWGIVALVMLPMFGVIAILGCALGGEEGVGSASPRLGNWSGRWQPVCIPFISSTRPWWWLSISSSFN